MIKYVTTIKDKNQPETNTVVHSDSLTKKNAIDPIISELFHYLCQQFDLEQSGERRLNSEKFQNFHFKV